MNKNQKQVQQSLLQDEKAVAAELRGIYSQALADIDTKVQALLARQDANTPTVIYQVQHQLALKKQISGILDQLHAGQFTTIEKYLEDCYTKGYTGVMYDLAGQGMPVLVGPDPKQVVQAVTLDSKISTDLYTALGEDVGQLKKKISATISRGISSGMSYGQIAQQLSAQSNTGLYNALRIARTEGHRIQIQSALDAQQAAKAQGCDVVKQWDSTLDGRTRPTHRQLDGQIREVDEDFEVTNAKGTTLKAAGPGLFGRPAEDIHCRCALLQRAKWALDDEELEVLKQRASFYGLDKTQDFDDFQAKYLGATQPAPVKPKKEIMTQKKLQQKLADGQIQMADLQAQLQADPGNKALQAQIDALQADMDAWDADLDKKQVQSKLKALKKDQILAQDAMDSVDSSKQYTNIWKDPVTVADYGAKQGAIAAKKSYFQGKLATATDPADKAKWQGLLADLDDFETQGSAYYTAQQARDKAAAEWAKLKKAGTLKVDTSAGAAYTQDRKDAALWFDRGHGGFAAADAYFDPPSKTLHRAATPKEQDGFYTYTSGSGGHNRPLAGFEKPWSRPGSGWEQQFYKGPKNVWIDFEGKGEQIRGLTTLIEKSTYPDDVWLQSGQGFATLEGFLGIPYGTVEYMNDAALQQYVGRRNVIYNFISTAVNEGGGGPFNAKPMKFNIYAPKGSQMLYASDVGAYGKGENEMILQRGGTYEITKIYWGNDATDGNRRKIFVDMEIHPEAGYDTFQQDPNEWTGSRDNYRTK